METRLGRISHIEFGFGGYQDAQIGLSITISGDGWGVADFRGDWGQGTKVGPHTKWTDAERDQRYADTVKYINGLLVDAKVRSVSDLRGKPVEVTLESNTLKSWRILTEVL